MERYYITGKSRLTGKREPISRTMTKEDAEFRLMMQLRYQRSVKFPAYTHLKVEKVQPEQLTMQFQD